MTLRNVLLILAIVASGVYVTTTLSDSATGQSVGADNSTVQSSDTDDGRASPADKSGSSAETPSPFSLVETDPPQDGDRLRSASPSPRYQNTLPGPTRVLSTQSRLGGRALSTLTLLSTQSRLGGGALSTKARKIVAAYAREKDAKQRSVLRSELQKLIGQQFDLRRQQREKEVVRIEARVRRLREILDKRSAARDEIVSHRLDQLIREANGLGWDHSAPSPSAWDSFGTPADRQPIPPTRLLDPARR